MLSLNCKHVQHVKIYLPCNVEVNLITHLGVIALFSLLAHLASHGVCRPLTFHILIFSSETTGPIATKLWWNGPWMAPFQNCVRWSRLPTKMATKLKIEKRGDEIVKKSSSLKLLSQFQPNFAEMILGWSPSKIVSGISDLRPRWPPQPNFVSGSRALPPKWLPQCSCVGIESSFDPGERLQAPGSLWLFCLKDDNWMQV